VTRTDRRAAVSAPYRERALRTLQLLVELGARAEEQAWISAGWPAEQVAPDFSLDRGDAIVVMREDVRDLHVAAHVRLRCTKLDFDPIRVAIQMLELARPERDTIHASSPRFYARHLEQLVRARYALIVVTHEVRLPAQQGVSSFDTGRVLGAALLFELADQALRGAFEFHADNSSQLEGNDRTIDDKLRADLEARFSAAIVRGIRERFPAGRPPATLGYV
jgi:hypothetical protein